MNKTAIGETMGDARFFARSGPYCLADIATAANGIAGPVAAGRVFTGVSPLQTATSDQVSFLDNRRYAAALEATQAGAVIVHPAMADRVPASAVPIVTPDTYEGWARVARLFHPIPACAPGIHPTSVVAATAIIHPTAEIGPFCVIGDAAEIGAFCRIGPYVSIGAGVSLGADCRIGSHASLSHAVVGERVYIYPGARIGQEGFSFANTKLGFLSIPQLGRVVIGDDVEVGANTTIDRGSVRDTVIGAGSRLDNLVQIGHNVQMGRCCVIVAQVGISGSTVLEDFVQVGGQAAMAGHLRIGHNVRLGRCCVIVAQVGISGSTVLEDFVQVGGQAAMAGHLRIGRGAQIGAQAGVIADAAPGAILLGSPAQSRHSFLRGVAIVKRLATRAAPS